MSYQKGVVAIAVSCLATLCIGILGAWTTEPQRGDLNGDGVVDSTDARILWRYLERGYPLNDTQLKCADLNNNGIVNEVDARLLWQRILENETPQTDESNNPYIEPSQEYDDPEPSSPDDYTFPTSSETTGETTTTTESTAAPTTEATTEPTTRPTAQVPQTPPTVSDPPSVTLQQSPVAESVYTDHIRITAVARDGSGTVTYDGRDREELQLGLTAVVKCELGASRMALTSTEAWKAQAVVSYTHIARQCYGKNGSYSFSVQVQSKVDLNNPNDYRIYQAVGEVLGQKVMIPSAGSDFQKLCYGFYSASVAGSSSSCHKVYTANLPYAQAVYSPETDALVSYYTGQSNAYTRTYTYTMSEIVSEVSYSLGCTVYYDTRDDAFSLYTTEWDGGYMYRSNLYYYDNYGDKVYVKGTTLRSALGLRSHAISVIEQEGDVLTLQVVGNGHGVGLSQLGAVIFANEYGWTYDQIVAHYFSITEGSAYQLCLPNW